MFLLFNQPESESLISFIKKKVNLTIENSEIQSEWILYIMTCYITQDGLETLFRELKENLKSNKNINIVEILVDKEEWAKLFYFREKELLEKLKNIIENESINIFVNPVDAGSKLFHAKSYALVQANKSEGFVITTSANLTENGLRRNLEIVNFLDDINFVKQYLDLFENIKQNFYLSNDKKLKLKKLAKAHLILSMGVFYKESDKIEMRFPIELNKTIDRDKFFAGDKASSNGDTKNIYYTLIDFTKIKNLLPPIIPNEIIRYMIETLIGRWMPMSIHEFIEDRIRLYKSAYIDFMKEKYLNPQSIENEKEDLRNQIKKHLRDGNHLKYPNINEKCDKRKDEYINKFVNKCYENIKREGLFYNSDSIINIFFDYFQIQSDTISNNLIKDSLNDINTNNKKRKRLPPLKEIIKKVDDYLEASLEIKDSTIEEYIEVFKVKIESIKLTEINKIEKDIKNLQKGDRFSALIKSNEYDEYGDKKYQLICNCILNEKLGDIDNKGKQTIVEISYSVENNVHYVFVQNIKSLKILPYKN